MRYAGFWKRMWAWSVDAMFIQVIMIPVAMLMPKAAETPTGGMDENALLPFLDGSQLSPEQMEGLLGSMATPTLTYTMLAVSAVYNILFVASSWQATPGKRWYKIRVVTVDGERLNLIQSTIRHLACAISTAPAFLGFVMAAFHPEKAALHDVIAGTRVIFTEDT